MKIQEKIYKLINDQIKIDIHTFIPEETVFPYVHIGDIKIVKLPYSGAEHYKITAEVSVYDEKYSNIRCIETMEKIAHILDKEFNLTHQNIEQTANLAWCGKIIVSTNFIQ